MATVCGCGIYPGMHPQYKDCDRSDNFLFTPTEEEKHVQLKCAHWPIDHQGQLNDDDVNVIDGVCLACGCVVNEEKASEANNYNGG